MHILIQILNLIAHLVHFFWIRSKSICIYSLPPNYKKEGGGGGVTFETLLWLTYVEMVVIYLFTLE